MRLQRVEPLAPASAGQQFYQNINETMPDGVALDLVRGRLDEHPDEALEYLGQHTWRSDGMLASTASDVMERYLRADSMTASDSLTRMKNAKTNDFCIKALEKWLCERESSAEAVPWLDSVQAPKVRSSIEAMIKRSQGSWQ